MPPTSTHSVTSNSANGNTPDPAILCTLSEVSRSLEAQGLHDEARALHELRNPIRQLYAAEQLLRYHHKVFRSPELQPAEKLVLIDANAAITWAEANGETTATELYIPARTQNVALSPKTYGRLLKKLHSCSALTRQEVRDDNGHTRVRIAATELTKDPLAIKRPEPSNWGGKRTPKCRLCGSEHFKPVAWECKGCGVTYDELPYPEEPDRDPEPPGPTPECPPPPDGQLVRHG